MSASAFRQLDSKIELKHLRYAAAAADHGSFRKAAEALNIQQSTLSRSILELEQATSTTIFKRFSGGVVVSDLGGDFIRMARGVLDQINEFALSAATPLPNELLRVGFCTSLSAGGPRTNLLDFCSRFPQFRLAMFERRRSRLSTKLQNGTLDLIVSPGRLLFECRAYGFGANAF
jgi:DNA-binding transcriptional LysR family regulator